MNLYKFQNSIDNLRGRSKYTPQQVWQLMAVTQNLLNYCQQPWYKRLRRIK